MKAFPLFLVITALIPLRGFAATYCQGISNNHIFTVSQKQNDVEITLEDEKLLKHSDLSMPNEGTLKIAGKNVTITIAANISVDEFLAKRALSRQLAVSMIAGRPELQGEQDLWFSFASDLYGSLKCQ